MAETRPKPDIVHGVPPVAVSSASTRVNRTGSWKYIRPVYQDRIAPCNQGCPVGIDVEGYMNLLRQGREQEARDLLLRENPLPAVTGRVCYHPCESACNRVRFDQGVAIHAVERMLGDGRLEQPLPAPAQCTRSERVAVVGSGPAGLACAYHLVRMGYAVTVYEAELEPGGVLRWGIPEYRLPKDVLKGEIARLAALGVEFFCGIKVGRDLDFDTLDGFDAVFVATGVHRSRRLGIPGEDLRGVLRGLDFLRAVNQGLRPKLGRRTVVVGGGNTAMDCARTARRLGAEVTVLYRRGRAEMPAHQEEVEEALREGVRFEFLAAPLAVRSDAHLENERAIDAICDSFEAEARADVGRHAIGLECERMRLGEPDRSGRRRPEPVPDSAFFVPADTVLTALGEEADVGFLPDDVQRRDGTLRVNPLGETSRTAVFAGGDLLDEPHTVAYALGSGKRAAIGIDHFLRRRAEEDPDQVELRELKLGPAGNLSVTRWREDDPVRRENPVNEVVEVEQLNFAHFRHAGRQEDGVRVLPEPLGDFTETRLGLSHEEALAEAQRCLNCGVCNGCEVCLVFCPDVAISRRLGGGFEIDYEHCKGCGVCAYECPRGAMTMTREGL